MGPDLSAAQADLSARSQEQRARRVELRARLAAERAELLSSLLGVDREALEDRPLLGAASAAALLNTLAAQEWAFTVGLEQFLGRPSEAGGVPVAPEPRPAGFDEALARSVVARTQFLDAFARVPDDVLFAPEEAASTDSPLAMATRCYWNDSSLSLRAGAWTRGEGLGESVGPIPLLRAAIRAARKELLTTVALVPLAAREVPAFEGGRTLIEIFRLVAGLERMLLAALAGAGYEISASAKKRAARADSAWEHAWADLHVTHTALLTVLDGLDDRAFERAISDGSGAAESLYTWVRGCLLHDRLHAAHIRADLEMDWPERLLR